MEFSDRLIDLVEQDIVPKDSQLVSTNNKLVVISSREGIVYRIARLGDSVDRDDPQDISYSHRVSWAIAQEAPVVSPLEEEPIVASDYVISRYPLMRSDPRLSEANSEEIFNLVHSVGQSLGSASKHLDLRSLQVPQYVSTRLSDIEEAGTINPGEVDCLREILERLEEQAPFDELTAEGTVLVHGDLKKDNIVSDNSGQLMVIDLDAAALGPSLYDLSSWRLRREMGDSSPMESVIDIARRSTSWDEDRYRALIGWKAVSSMSFILRYEDDEMAPRKISALARAAILLGAFDHLVK